MLAEWLRDMGRTVTVTREPGGTDLGVQLRDIILHSRGYIAPRAEALLYAADRAHHIATVVRPAIARGDVVIQDRYIDSSVAYQGAGRVLDSVEIRGLSEWATETLEPDLTILLDLDVEQGRARLDASDRVFDRLEAEKHEFHDRVRAAFLEIAATETGRVAVIDGANPVDEIAAKIRTRVAPLL